MQEWISIKEAQELVINWSVPIFTKLIDNNTIIGTKQGKGAKRMINTKSLRDYLETLSQPMGM